MRFGLLDDVYIYIYVCVCVCVCVTLVRGVFVTPIPVEYC
jgi:hypothetical protein